MAWHGTALAGVDHWTAHRGRKLFQIELITVLWPVILRRDQNNRVVEAIDALSGAPDTARLICPPLDVTGEAAAALSHLQTSDDVTVASRRTFLTAGIIGQVAAAIRALD